MTIYHKHHIVPRHMGGTDEPSNLTELTIEEHAEAHRILYETYGKHEDYLAWQGLLALIPKAEIMRELHKLGRRKTDQFLFDKYGVTNPSHIPEVREKLSITMKKQYQNGKRKSTVSFSGKTHSQETKNKIGAHNALKQKGSRNSQFGSMWITNGTENKKIKSIDIIPETWYKGRVTK
jgi:hypothetical protein